MTTINVTMTPMGSATGSGAASGSGGYPADLPGLQRKLVGLMKEMKDANADRSPGALERIKLLQIEIQACQLQIQRLQQAAQKAAQPVPSDAPAKAAGGAFGARIDTTA